MELIKGVETVSFLLVRARILLFLCRFQRDHDRVQKFRYLAIVGIVVMSGLTIITIVLMTQPSENYENVKDYSPHFTTTVIGLLLNIYVFICISSLYEKFREEAFLPRTMHTGPYVVNFQSPPYNPHLQQSIAQQAQMYPPMSTKY